MKGYVIKATYVEGMHAGKSYLIAKTGYCLDDDGIFFEDWCYKTLRAAKAVCTRKFKDNELRRKSERDDEKFQMEHRGRPAKSFYIYESETYEPYEVEMIQY